MSHDTTDAPLGEEHVEHEASGTEKTAATFLWAVVGLGIAYGVGETAIKVAALFG